MHVNNDFQKNSNLSHVFETIWRKKSVSRIDISRNLNLYRSTVSNIINTLLENHVISETEIGLPSEKGGRKPVFLTINKDYGAILGIEIQTDAFRGSLISFDGTILETFKDRTPVIKENQNTAEFFTEIVELIVNKLLVDTKKFNIPVLGICLAIPGIVDIDKGIILRSEPFSLYDYNFKEILAPKFSVPLFIENDARCCSWFQKTVSEESVSSDFMCVLARRHDTGGISIGISITMDGRVINGKKHAVGEYVSRSWIPGKKSQTGLPNAVLSTINTDRDSYREWLIDLFGTLTTFVPLLEPSKIYVFGQKSQDKEFIDTVIDQDVIQFRAIMENCGCELVVVEDDEFSISRGAAFMFLQKLFEIQTLEGEVSYSHLDWDDLFVIRSKFD